MPGGIYRREMAPGDFLDGTVQEISFPGGEMPFSKENLPAPICLISAVFPPAVLFLNPRLSVIGSSVIIPRRPS